MEQVERKIASLGKIRDALHHLIGECSGDGPTSDCPILEAMSMHQFHVNDES